MKPAGYRFDQVTTPDDKKAPRVVYFVPVDVQGKKCAATIVGTLGAAAVAALEPGQVYKALPKLGKFKPPPKRPEEA